VLRILKIITPVKCVIPCYAGRIVQPEEGKFYRRFSPSKNFLEKGHRVWSVNIDKRDILKRGFRLLWDATDILLSK
jgi:hypothetical protein